MTGEPVLLFTIDGVDARNPNTVRILRDMEEIQRGIPRTVAVLSTETEAASEQYQGTKAIVLFDSNRPGLNHFCIRRTGTEEMPSWVPQWARGTELRIEISPKAGPGDALQILTILRQYIGGAIGEGVGVYSQPL